jgi:hypothetical protein
VNAPRRQEGLGRKESKWRKSVMNLSGVSHPYSFENDGLTK